MITFSFQITWGFPFMLLIKKKEPPENTTHGTIALFYVIYDCISPSCVDLNACLSRENENAAQWKWGAGISRSLRLAIQWPAHQHVCSQETTPAFRGLMRQRSVHTPVVPEFFFILKCFVFFPFHWMMMIFKLPAGKKQTYFDVRLMSPPLLDPVGCPSHCTVFESSRCCCTSGHSN